MKRTALILLTAIYLLSTLGVAVDSYYCRGKLQLTSALRVSQALPACKMKHQMKNCCKTKKQYFKVNDLHIYASAFSLGIKLFPASQVPYLAFQPNISATNRELFEIDINAPPKGNVIPPYILHCNYRI